MVKTWKRVLLEAFAPLFLSMCSQHLAFLHHALSLLPWFGIDLCLGGYNSISFGLLDALVFRTPCKWCFSTPPQLYFSIQPLTSSVFQHLSVWPYSVSSCNLPYLQLFDPYPQNSVSVNKLKFSNTNT